jgi:DNA-binding XRE family transcriptional regulator
MAKNRSNPPESSPIHERLRARRTEMGKGLREMARHLDIVPAHLTDIEYGRRNPSPELLVKIAKAYGMTEIELRSGYRRPDEDVAELASETTIAIEKVPAFLRKARGLTTEQWDKLIKQAEKFASDQGGGT